MVECISNTGTSNNLTGNELHERRFYRPIVNLYELNF